MGAGVPALERRHDVLAPTLPGHAGGPRARGRGGRRRPWSTRSSGRWTRPGIETAHVARATPSAASSRCTAERGRARTVVALAPAGGWAGWTTSRTAMGWLRQFLGMHELAQSAAPFVDELVASTRTSAARRTLELIAERLGAHPGGARRAPDRRRSPRAPTSDRRSSSPSVTGGSLAAGAHHVPRQGRLGYATTRCCRGRRRPHASAKNGSHTPTGSSSTTSATARSWTRHSRSPS